MAGEAFRIYHKRPILSELVTDKECIETTCNFLGRLYHGIYVSEPDFVCRASPLAVACSGQQKIICVWINALFLINTYMMMIMA